VYYVRLAWLSTRFEATAAYSLRLAWGLTHADGELDPDKNVSFVVSSLTALARFSMLSF